MTVKQPLQDFISLNEDEKKFWIGKKEQQTYIGYELASGRGIFRWFINNGLERLDDSQNKHLNG